MEESRLREQQRMEEKSQHEPVTTELDTGGAPLSESPSNEQESSLSPSGEATADDHQCTITATGVGDGGPQTEEQHEDLASASLRRGATEEARALKGHDGHFDAHLRRALAWYRRGAQSRPTHGAFSAAAAAQCTVVAQMLAGAFGGVGVDDEGAVLHYAVAAASGDINALLAMGHRHAHGCEKKGPSSRIRAPSTQGFWLPVVIACPGWCRGSPNPGEDSSIRRRRAPTAAYVLSSVMSGRTASRTLTPFQAAYAASVRAACTSPHQQNASHRLVTSMAHTPVWGATITTGTGCRPAARRRCSTTSRRRGRRSRYTTLRAGRRAWSR